MDAILTQLILTNPKSETIFEKLKEVIPGGVNSPVRACLGMDQTPLIADYAYEDMVVDVDGRAFIDYCGSWGALIHGSAHKEILTAARYRMEKGTTFGLSTEIEEKMARKIIEIMPSIEKIRFVSTGTEATMSAARLARGFTGRDIIIKFAGHYHGHADFFLVKAGSGVSELNASTSAGIPNDLVRQTLSLPFNDLEALESIFNHEAYQDKIAAIILEPIAGNMGLVKGTEAFIQKIRKLTIKHGSLLIFDEVMTGFRVGLQGAQGLYKIKPDLTCFGKIIGGGFPAAAFGGRADIMNYLSPLGPVYQAGTLSGNPVAMEAGLKALTLLEKPQFYEELNRKTNLLTEPVRKFLKEQKIKACIQQEGSMFTLFFGSLEVNNMEQAKTCDQVQFKKFFKFMFDNGVYIPPLQMEAWFVSNAHSEEHLVKTKDLIIQFFLQYDKSKIKNGEEKNESYL